MKYWNRSGDAFELNGWHVEKDWHTGLWDIRENGLIVAEDFSTAQKAIEAAERMMER